MLMIPSLSAGPVSPYSFSHRLARGLRRNLMQGIADEEARREGAWRVIKQIAFPLRSIRERRALLKNAVSRMESAMFRVQKRVSAGRTTHDGFDLNHHDVNHADGCAEAQIMVLHISMSHCSKEQVAERDLLGGISQHAIERLFQRVGHMDINSAMSEMADALHWMRMLHQASSALAGVKRIQQLLLPTRNGTFLCQRDIESGFLFARTWVTSGSNPRIDMTLACMRAWHLNLDCEVEGNFQGLMEQPENQWMLRPYQAN